MTNNTGQPISFINVRASIPDSSAGGGDPRDFWDEFHAFVTGAAIPAGATFSLQKDSTNTASFYWINPTWR